MSDTLEEADVEFFRRLAEHEQRYEKDEKYRAWWDSIPNKPLPRIPIVF